MKTGIRTLLAVLLGASMLLTACGGDGGDTEPTTDDAVEEPADDAGGDAGGGGGRPVKVEAFDFGFKPTKLSVTSGEEVSVTLENTGSAPHTFTANELDVDISASGGETAEGSFTAGDPGDYEYICTIHPQMKGTITVK